MLKYMKDVYQAWIDYPEREGKRLAGKYRIDRFIGMGSYGLTYLCRELSSGKEVVLKHAKPSKGELGKELLQREIQMMRQLKHPGIPQCLEAFEHKKRLYLVTEYVRGRTVEELIFERGAVFPEQEALRIMRRLAEIVCYVHDRGYVHLDIRVPNVMLQGEKVWLIDFGLASRIGETERLDSSADEEAERRRTAEPASDMYAMGHFLLYMLYSAYPDDGDTGSEASWEEELDISSDTRRMTRKLFQLDAPYEDVRAFIRELESALGGRT